MPPPPSLPPSAPIPTPGPTPEQMQAMVNEATSPQIRAKRRRTKIRLVIILALGYFAGHLCDMLPEKMQTWCDFLAKAAAVIAGNGGV